VLNQHIGSSLTFSQYIEVEHVTALLGRSAKGFGYLLKERVSDIDEFIDALRRVAAGGSAIDPGLVSLLVSPPHRRPPLLDNLTDREKEILELMASGKSNRAIAAAVFMRARTVEAHIHEIFHKLQLEPAPENHRRVLAVLAHLQVGDPPTGD
jgi:DNA-binding NarL/FixJ family response regulator